MKQLNSTKSIPEESILRAYKKGYGYAKLKVISINDYFLGAVAEKDFFENISNGDKIETYLWVENIASYEFTLQTSGRIVPPPYILFFKHTEEISWTEERKCLKAKVDLPVKFFIINTGEKEKSFTSEELVIINGNITGLSDREAFFECSTNLKAGMFIKGHLLINNTDIEFIGKISAISENDTVHYRISFSGMNDRDTTSILDFVFSTYRE